MTLDDARAAYRVLEELRDIAGQCSDDQLATAVDEILSSMLAALLGVPR